MTDFERSDDPTAYRHFPTTGLHSIAHLIPRSGGRCGIYILSFRNGERYVGQALDVTSRFIGHRRTYGDDIVRLAFRPAGPSHLDIVERSEIQRLHAAGTPLRNVVHMPGRLLANDFDELVSRSAQQTWLASPRAVGLDGSARPVQPEMRQRFSDRYHRLASRSCFPQVADVLRRYVAWTIPNPAQTELTYWSVSALPAYKGRTFSRLLTVSLRNLETVYVYFPRDAPDKIAFSINVDLPTLANRWGGFDRFLSRSSRYSGEADAYRARPGVAGLQCESPADARHLLAQPGVVAAARRLNLDLMRKGASLNWRTHCFDLADIAFRPARPGSVEVRRTDATGSGRVPAARSPITRRLGPA